MDAQTFGERVNHMRVAYGWRVTALALRAQLSDDRVTAIEGGAGRPPTTREKLTLARVLSVSVEYLETGEGLTGLQSRPTFRAFMNRLEAKTPEQQDRLLVLFTHSIDVYERKQSCSDTP